MILDVHTAKVLAELDSFFKLLEDHRPRKVRSSLQSWEVNLNDPPRRVTPTQQALENVERRKLLEDEIKVRLPAIEMIAQRVDANQLNLLRQRTNAWPWDAVRDATLHLIGVVKQQEAVEAMLRPQGPVLSAEGLHPWVWEPAADLWDGGHRRAAIQKASSNVANQLQLKVERWDISGTDLVTQVFRKDDPKIGEPRLRFPGLREGSEPFKNAHFGAMYFGQGCFMGIRNPASHSTEEIPQQEALEYLASLSVLARWIDAAELRSEPPPTLGS